MTQRAAGFTLLEVLIAMAIFALVATAGYTALQQGIAVQERLGETREDWRRLESALALLAGDLDQARDRAPRAPGREWSLAFQGFRDVGPAGRGGLLRFTRGGHTSFREGPVSPYLRVAYRLREGTLYRATWPRLDAPAGGEAREAALLKGLQGVEVRYLGSGERWSERWPPRTASDGEPAAGLPRALEVTLETANHGTIRRLLHVGPPG